MITNMNYGETNESSGNNLNSCSLPSEHKLSRKDRIGNSGKIIALALCCSLVGGVVGAGGFALGSNIQHGKQDETVPAENIETILQGQRESIKLNVTNVDTNKEMTAAEIYAANVNSTVGITTAVTTNYFGFQTTAAVSGSGFILTEHGYIITNYHVVEDGSDIKVTTYDNATYEAELVGYDESSDLAVLKIEADGLTPVILGDSDQMNVGDSVVAIGNPLGELTFSLTSGSVSALNRKITINNTAMDLIQTDCAINSGNSGGALFNMYGELIGITDAKYSGDGSSGEASIDNIGFAIPINGVRNTIQSIIEDGTITKPYIGVSLSDLGYEYQKFGLTGAVVQGIAEGSPAEEAGLQLNDIITKMNGKEISSTSDIRNCLSEAADGEIISLTVSRQGKTIDLEIKVVLREQSALPKTDPPQEQQANQTSFSAKQHETEGTIL